MAKPLELLVLPDVPVGRHLGQEPADELRRQHVGVLSQDGSAQPQGVGHQHDHPLGVLVLYMSASILEVGEDGLKWS